MSRIDLIIETPSLAPYVNSAVTRIKIATGLEIFAYPKTSNVPGATRIAVEPTPEPDMNGYYDPTRKRISIHPECRGNCLRSNVLHEICHMLGARHVEQGEGVMSPYPGTQVLLTAADIGSICSGLYTCKRRIAEI